MTPHSDEDRQRHLVEVRVAAHSVVLVWRDVRQAGNGQVIPDELQRNLDRLLAVFERRAARHLGELFAHQAMEWIDFPRKKS
jgi:hypothetical protein